MFKSKGFTLIEVSISLLLGSILLQALLSFYIQLYRESQIFTQQVTLRNEAYNVENYLRLYIRQAEKIKIVTTKGKVIEPLADNDVVEESLNSIMFIHKVQNIKTSTNIVLETNNSTSLEISPIGKKRLYYYGTSNVISNLVEDITITYFKDIEEVMFHCTLNKMNEENPNLIYTFTFTESIAHKQPYH